jgi:hypothetical protein
MCPAQTAQRSSAPQHIWHVTTAARIPTLHRGRKGKKNKIPSEYWKNKSWRTFGGDQCQKNAGLEKAWPREGLASRKLASRRPGLEKGGLENLGLKRQQIRGIG